jgi:hypothetical protein
MLDNRIAIYLLNKGGAGAGIVGKIRKRRRRRRKLGRKR